MNNRTLAEFVASPLESVWGTGPLLVARPLKNPESKDDPDEGTFTFDTPSRLDLSSSSDRLATGGVGDYLVPDALVIPVVKTGRNPFALVSVGRARNNDVILLDRSVSKVHAYFEQPSPRNSSWTLRDAGSLNGTHILLSSGSRKLADVPTAVDHGFEIRLGSVRCLFTDQETLQNAAIWASRSWRKDGR